MFGLIVLDCLILCHLGAWSSLTGEAEAGESKSDRLLPSVDEQWKKGKVDIKQAKVLYIYIYANIVL